jgi:hypothetical protein
MCVIKIIFVCARKAYIHDNYYGWVQRYEKKLKYQKDFTFILQYPP